MFSNLSIYRVAGFPASATELAQAIEPQAFHPTTPNQTKAAGFVPPRAAHGAIVEAVNGQWITRVMIETRKVPSDALQRKIDETVAAIEQSEGRKPGRQERRELKEAAEAELLPQAFPKQAAVPVWIDPRAGLLMIGSTSAAHIDSVIEGFSRSVQGASFAPVVTHTAPQSLMLGWLLEGEAGGDFILGRSCDLQASDESKATVKYKNQPLDRDDVRAHLREGKLPSSLALSWLDRAAFTLTAGMQIKRIDLLDGVFKEQAGQDSEGDSFDADVVIFTGEVSKVIAQLVEQLGGIDDAPKQPEPQAQAAQQAPDTLDGASDPLLDRARALVVAHQKASISMLQRLLEVTFNRANRLLDALELEGIVGPSNSVGFRQVLASKEAA
jgi:recombination associated protein RdgC